MSFGSPSVASRTSSSNPSSSSKDRSCSDCTEAFSFTYEAELSKGYASEHLVEAVVLVGSRSLVKGAGYEEMKLQRDHPIFNTKPAVMSQKIGFPLVVEKLPSGAGDNRNIMYLLIAEGALNGWREGDYLVARQDMEPLTVTTMAAIDDYILDVTSVSHLYGKDAAQRFYNRRKLEKYIANHLNGRQEARSTLTILSLLIDETDRKQVSVEMPSLEQHLGSGEIYVSKQRKV